MIAVIPYLCSPEIIDATIRFVFCRA